MDKRKAVQSMLSNLSKENFAKFCHELVHRKEEPQVDRNKVEGRDFLRITDVLVSTFDETGAVVVAVELLNEIECNAEAKKLMEATGGPSSENGSRDTAGPSAGGTARYTMVDGQHFVDKHRTELINRVNCIGNILDKLFDEEVIQQAIYDTIRKIPTNQEQMRELFSGPLNAAGPRGKEVFYRILEKEEKYLIDQLKGKK
ncbi:apoptosis-associated speck-like protein containing a CARD [Trematomus bernacchii]|uniref:apoptosis-associated speck-like protein containing a CARD n=1 Tax=Trematomus bernacchii TaxID=40690 RepID=UPI00146D6B2F|nr:apoptosis-associated speck-like protein containing a CARD [Trematomus bernacchii]